MKGHLAKRYRTNKETSTVAANRPDAFPLSITIKKFSNEN